MKSPGEMYKSYVETLKVKACKRYLRLVSEYGEEYAAARNHFNVEHIAFIVERNAHGELVARQDKS